jgi:hypothetical protein
VILKSKNVLVNNKNTPNMKKSDRGYSGKGGRGGMAGKVTQGQKNPERP